MSEMRFDGTDRAAWTLVLAHGAGQGMDSPFMAQFAEGLSARSTKIGGLRVVRFEFPYMQAMRRSGKRRPPDRTPDLMNAWFAALAALRGNGLVAPERLVIGGKSLGGRIASMIADQAQIRALVCLGYPFHPPGKPAQTRTAHLHTLQTPTLILQGTRDPFGNRAEVLNYPLAGAIRLSWLEGADHDFKPRSGTGVTQPQHFNQAMETIIAFINDLDRQSADKTRGGTGHPCDVSI